VKIVWTGPARQDLRQVFEYIAGDSPKATSKLLAVIKECAALLQDNPHMGRLGRVNGTRELIIIGTPYILPYRVKDSQIQILAVFHGARKWANNF
jgi:toxin ParE1/3/4